MKYRHLVSRVKLIKHASLTWLPVREREPWGHSLIECSQRKRLRKTQKVSSWNMDAVLRLTTNCSMMKTKQVSKLTKLQELPSPTMPATIPRIYPSDQMQSSPRRKLMESRTRCKCTALWALKSDEGLYQSKKSAKTLITRLLMLMVEMWPTWMSLQK